VVTEFISLDGIVEDPGGAEAGAPADWTAFDRGVEGDQLKMAELEAADVQLLGRVTYEGYAAAWPSIQDEAGSGSSQLVIDTTPQFFSRCNLDCAERHTRSGRMYARAGNVLGTPRIPADACWWAGCPREHASCPSTYGPAVPRSDQRDQAPVRTSDRFLGHAHSPADLAHRTVRTSKLSRRRQCRVTRLVTGASYR
jgi:hypothetical protein